jgi:hypothetical protein
MSVAKTLMSEVTRQECVLERKRLHTIDLGVGVLENGLANVVHRASHCIRLIRQLVPPVVRLYVPVQGLTFQALCGDRRTGSAKGPPLQRDSMFNCVASWVVPPGRVADTGSLTARNINPTTYLPDIHFRRAATFGTTHRRESRTTSRSH